jgi:hypothetical protein
MTVAQASLLEMLSHNRLGFGRVAWLRRSVAMSYLNAIQAKAGWIVIPAKAGI